MATYNILLGGERRRDLVRNVLRRIDADVVALQEVREVETIRDLAGDLGMELFLGEPSDPESPMHTAILTRLPVRAWRNRRHHGRMLRSHLHCDIETGGTELPVLGVHCLHLAARFGDRNKGEARRIREIGAVLTDIADEPALPHMLIGDFNALSPGDDILATSFFRRMNDLRRAGSARRRRERASSPRSLPSDGDANGARGPLAARRRRPTAPRRHSGASAGRLAAHRRDPVSRAMDRLLGRLIERWTIERLLKRGIRRLLPPGASARPRAHVRDVAARRHASTTSSRPTDLAAHVLGADVVGGRTWPDPDAAVASDHYPVVADFSV